MENQSYWHKTPDYKVLIKTNSQGIRSNIEFPYKKPENTLRIVVLGDSFGMGYGVNLEDTFLNQMKVKLNEQLLNKKIEIINLSVSGHGNAEQLIMLKEKGLKYNPDLVLLCWHRTDFLDNLRSNLFKIKNNKLTQISDKYLPGVKIREFLFQFSFYRFLAGNSHFYNWFRDQAGILIKTIMTLGKSKEKKNQEEKITNDKILTIAILKKIKDVCSQKNIKFLIFDIPEHKGKEKYWSVFPKNISEENFHIVSPAEKFSQSKGELLYWENSHGHFTPKGCKISGHLLADYILENKLY